MKRAIDKATFAAGEVSPRLRGRVDLARQQIAVARAENYVVLVEGGMTRRPGTRFIQPFKNEDEEGKFIPFHYADGDSYNLHANGDAMRFFRNGGVIVDGPDPYEIAIPWPEAALADLRWTSSENTIFLACRGYAPRVLTRSGHTSWALSLYTPVGGPIETQNLNTGLTLQASAATGTGITVTANTARFVADDVGTIWRLDEPTLAAVPLWKGNDAGVTAGHLVRNNGNVYEASNTANSGPNAPTHTEGTVSSGLGNVSWIYRHSGFGFFRVTAIGGGGTTATADVLSELPASAVSGASYRWWPPAWSAARGWPETVRLHDQRLLFTRGDEWWLSEPNDLFSLQVTPSNEASAIAARMTSPDGSLVAIRWAMSSGLLALGTASSEWSIRGASSFGALTIDNARPLPESGEGSAEHVPALVDAGALFIGASRQRLHFAKFEPLAESVEVEEVSIAARHILKGLARCIAFQRDPNRIAWIALMNGALRGVTFMPKEGVIGWHRHPMTNGLVEDLATVPAGNETSDQLYVAVKRMIDGETRRYIEILEPFFEPADEDAPTADGAFFVDCGLSYAGAPATVISGLEHLEGQTVRVFADGAQRSVEPVVTGGEITIAPAAETVVVGLPIVGRVRSLPIEAETPTGSSKGRAKRANAVIVELVETAGGSIISNGGDPETIEGTGSLGYGAAIPLITGKRIVHPFSPHDTEAVIELLSDNALPCTLAGWTPDIDFTEG